MLTGKHQNEAGDEKLKDFSYFMPTRINQVFRFFGRSISVAFVKSHFENRLRVKYADSVGDKFLTNF